MRPAPETSGLGPLQEPPCSTRCNWMNPPYVVCIPQLQLRDTHIPEVAGAAQTPVLCQRAHHTAAPYSTGCLDQTILWNDSSCPLQPSLRSHNSQGSLFLVISSRTIAETSSEAQKPTTAVETSSPAEPNAPETKADTTTNAGIGASRNEMSPTVSSHDSAEGTLLEISTMLEENATRLRQEKKGKMLLMGDNPYTNMFNKRGQPPNLVLPPRQGRGVSHWEPDHETLARWQAYRTEQPIPAGQIWWMVDAIPPKQFGLGVKYLFPRYMHIDEAILLIECLLQGAVEGDGGLRGTFDFEDENARIFISSYIKPSDSLARRSLCKIFQIRALEVRRRRLPEIDILHLQYHLVYLRYLPKDWWQHGLESLSEDRPGLILERHSAKIRQLSHARTPDTTAIAGQTGKESSNYELSEEHFEECRLSMLLYLYGKGGEFRLVLVGDSGAEVNLDPWLPFEERHGSSSLRLDPNSLGHLAGLTHFLINLVHLMDTWHEGWKKTLNKIDDIVGFEMDHTFDDKQLESYIFDDSDSMDLSKQYFTALQLLRIARQRIETQLIVWKELHNLPDNNWESTTHHKVLSTLDKFVLSEGGEDILEIWEEQRERVTQLFRTKAKSLTELIDQKTKEVESLRDGLFNATSLREAMRGMALNRAIYLFTAVTIIYTPLGFLAALWALPNLNTTSEGDSTHPSSSNAFLATFIIIPVLTYLVCGYHGWYLTAKRT